MYLKGDGGEAKSGFHFLKEKKGYVRINKIYMNVHILEKYFKRPDTLYNTLQRNLNSTNIVLTDQKWMIFFFIQVVN